MGQTNSADGRTDAPSADIGESHAGRGCNTTGSPSCQVQRDSGAARTSDGYVKKAIGRTPGEPQALRGKRRKVRQPAYQCLGLTWSRPTRQEPVATGTQKVAMHLVVSASQGAPNAKGQSADGIVDEKSVGKISQMLRGRRKPER